MYKGIKTGLGIVRGENMCNTIIDYACMISISMLMDM